jgi:hypothetical protein
MDGKAKQYTRGRVQDTVASGEGTGQGSGVDDVWEDLYSGTVDGNDVWTEGGRVRSNLGNGGKWEIHLRAALPVSRNKYWLLWGTSIPVIKRPRICRQHYESDADISTQVPFERT